MQFERSLGADQRTGVTRGCWALRLPHAGCSVCCPSLHPVCVPCRPTWWCRRIATCWPCRICRRPRLSWTTGKPSWMWCRPSMNRPWPKSRSLSSCRRGLGQVVTSQALLAVVSPSFLSCFLSPRVWFPAGIHLVDIRYNTHIHTYTHSTYSLAKPWGLFLTDTERTFGERSGYSAKTEVTAGRRMFWVSLLTVRITASCAAFLTYFSNHVLPLYLI